MSKAFYVAADGRDDHAGSENAPFRTLHRAQEQVRQTIQNENGESITVYVRGGHYELDSPLRFDERDTGRSGCEVRYSAYPGEEAFIAGGKRIEGWQRHSGDIWFAKLDKGMRFHTLYADGHRVKQARLPADRYFETDLSDSEDDENRLREGIRMRAEDYATANIDFTEAKIYFWPGEGEWNWFAESRQAASFDSESRYIRFHAPAVWPIGQGSRYFIQGSLALLRAPGQFYLDEDKGLLYYWPSGDCADPNEQTIIAPLTSCLLHIGGTAPERPAANLVFSGLAFGYTDTFSEYRMMEGNDERPEHREGIIYMNGAERIRIENCKIVLSGSCGIYLDHYARGITIEGNEIRSLGYNGIAMNGFPPGAGPFSGPEQSRTNGGHRITNNRIVDGGELIGHGCGIFLYQSGDNEISHNLIANMPRYGISMKGLRHKTMPEQLYGIPVTWENHWDFLHCRNNYIAYNDISNVMTDSQDGGLIEAWGVGRGNIIHGNHLHDSGIHFSFGFGIYLDDAADDFTVTHNVIRNLYSTGNGKLWMLIFSKGIGNRIRNNLLVSNPQAIAAIGSQEMAGEDNKHIEIEGNIVYNSGYLYYFVNFSEERFAAADRNLFWNNGKPCKVAGCLPLSSDTPDELERSEYSWEQWRSLLDGRYDGSTVQGDPLFVEADIGDYRLQAESPAYRLGWDNIDFQNIGPKYARI